MKSCEEMTRSVRQRGEAEILARKKRRSVVINTAAGTAVICAAAGFVIMSSNYDKPEVSDAPMESIVFSGESITEYTTETIAETTHTEATEPAEEVSEYEGTVNEPTATAEPVQTDAAVQTETVFTETAVTTGTSVTATTAVSASDEDFLTSGYCGGNVYYELDENNRTLYFYGSGSDVDVSSLIPLVGKFDTVVIEQGITGFEWISENHLFGLGNPLTIYCYSDFSSDRLQKYLGKHLTFIILDE